MKFTLSWLRDHLETDASLEQICDTLNTIGLEVEGVEDPAETLGAFVIARVLEAKPHPDADKLRVCVVDYGADKPIQVVCGAPNARTGLVGVFAPEGTYVPGTDLLLKKAKIRGVESSGMLCSERELELSEDHDGIIDLDADLEDRVGDRFIDVRGLNDPTIEIAITPNRPDALAVRGVARDLAAAGLGKLKKEQTGFTKKGDYPCPVAIELDFPDDKADACPTFVGRYVRGVRNGPSPQWLQNRLRAIGLRPISALVDITNYISYDRARPLHVYDAGKLTGSIRARMGRDGEHFLALDGKTYNVTPEMTVIADDAAALGFGGIMGGEATGATDDTVNVLIESAYFAPVRTALTGRATGIHSDARYRFERGIDPQSCILGANLAAQMIVDLCGGEISELQMAGGAPTTPLEITFDPGLVAQITGVDVKDGEIKRTLKALGFDVNAHTGAGKGGKKKDKKSSDGLSVTVPTWRPDVHGPADLVEEVIRIHGIDHVPATPLPALTGVARPVMTTQQKRVRQARRLLASRGLVEAVTWSFIPPGEAAHFGGQSDALELANPISVEMSHMRPSLLPGLLGAAARNLHRAMHDPALFEVGQVFLNDTDAGQKMAVAAVRCGTGRPGGAGRHWSGAAADVDLFDVRADLNDLLEALGLDPSKLQIAREAPSWFHPGRSGVIKLGPKNVLGAFGEVHPTTLKTMDVDGPAVAFELFLDALPEPKRKSTSRPALDASDLNPVRKDLAFIVDADVAAGDLVRAAAGADKKLIADVTVFDVFTGGALGEDKKSIAIELTLQPRSQTLSDEDIEAVLASVIAKVEKATGGEIRGR